MPRIKQNHAIKTVSQPENRQAQRLRSMLQTKRNLHAGLAALGKTQTPQRIKTTRRITEGETSSERRDPSPSSSIEILSETTAPHPRVRKMRRKSAKLAIPQDQFGGIAGQLLEMDNRKRSESKEFQPKGLKALQMGVESFMADFFDDAHQAATHNRRDAVKSKDLALVRSILGKFGGR